MKKLFLFITYSLFAINITAGDVIYRTMNDSINAKVITVNNSEVTYKMADYEDGPLFTIKTADIVAIHYANGIFQYFAETPDAKPKTTEAKNSTETQDEDKRGHAFFGGTAEIGYTGVFEFAAEPILGYEFNDIVAIGTGIGPIVAAGSGRTVVMGIVEPFIRLCAWHNDIVFIDFKLTTGIAFTGIVEMCQVGVRPSLRVRLSKHCDMSVDIGLFGAQYTYGSGWAPAVGVGATTAGVWFAQRF